MTDLYRFYDASERLLYVGISLHAAQRASQHRKDKQWWPDVARMEVEHLKVATRADAEVIERAAIASEGPRYNVVHNGSEQIAPLAMSPVAGRKGLVGRFVLTPDEKTGWPLCNHQGVILERVEERFYVVQWFSWLTGEPHSSEVVEVTEMTGWRFYDDQEEFIHAADSASSQRDRLLDREAARIA